MYSIRYRHRVLAASYDRWGTECLSKFNGMWAGILYDDKEGRVFIARDRLGKKPLFYFVTDSTLFIASEQKLFSKYKRFQYRLTSKLSLSSCRTAPNYISKILSFREVKSLEPAQFIDLKIGPVVRFNAKNLLGTEPNLSSDDFSEEEARKLAADFYELLKDAVKLRLKADVPCGICLSGGLDSSSIAYLIHELAMEGYYPAKRI